MERITAKTEAKTVGSRGSTWNMMTPITAETPHARAIPMASPIAIWAAPCFRINPTTISRVGPQGHADAHLLAPPTHREGQHAVQPDGCHKQGGHSEDDEDRAEYTVKPTVSLDRIGHTAYVVDG